MRWSGGAQTGRYCRRMDVNFWTVVGAVAGVLALIGIVIGVVTYRRQFPKRELQYEVETFPLLRAYSHPASGLTVHLDGRPITEPHVVRVRVSSRSRADIPSGSFDSGAPIKFESSKPIVVTGWTAKSDSSIGLEIGAGRAVTEFSIPAQLIARKASGSMSGIAEGQPAVTVASKSLIDIDITRISRSQNPTVKSYKMLRAGLWFVTLLSTFGLGASVVSLLTTL